MKINYSVVSPRKALEMTNYGKDSGRQAILLSCTPAISGERGASVIKLEVMHNSAVLVRTITKMRGMQEFKESEIIEVAYQYDILNVIGRAIYDDYVKLTHENKLDPEMATHVYLQGYRSRDLAERILHHAHSEFKAFAKDPISDKIASEAGYHGWNSIDWDNASIEVSVLPAQQKAGKDDHKGQQKCGAMGVRHLSSYQAIG